MFGARIWPRAKPWAAAKVALALFLFPAALGRMQEVVPELSPLPTWDPTINLRFNSGYKDNLLLNRQATERSYLLASAVDLSLLRLPWDCWQLLFFLSAEDVRFPEGDRVQKEQTLMGFAQAKLDWSGGLQGTLSAQYVYLDQVVDTSVTENTTTAVALRGHQLSVRPAARLRLGLGFWIEAEGALQRQWLAEPLDDYGESGPKLTLGRDYGHRSTGTLGYQWVRRVYDTRTPLTAAGDPLSGTLRFDRHEVELALRHHWDARRRWRTLTRLGFQRNLDNGSGYFDYDRWQAAQQIRFSAGGWELRGQGRVGHYEFAVQRAGDGNADRRDKTLLAAGLRAQRKLGRHWAAFAEYQYEESLSNRRVDEYRVHHVAAGVELEF